MQDGVGAAATLVTWPVRNASVPGGGCGRAAPPVRSDLVTAFRACSILSRTRRSASRAWGRKVTVG